MDQIKFSSILNESQKQFTDLFQENKITSAVKKAGAAINSASKEIKSAAKDHASKVKETATDHAKDKAKQVITDKAKQLVTPAKKEEASESKEEPKKKKSGLDDLDTVSKGSTGKEKVKEAASKVGKTVKETASNPIKAGTIVGAVAGGAAGAATGFGVGHMVKDVADGVKQVKNKLLENYNFNIIKPINLQIVLADLHILSQTTHNFHWNIESKSFYEYHKMLDDQYEILNELIDDFAEYIRQIGFYPKGNFSEYLKISNILEPNNSEKLNDYEMINKLINDYELFIDYLKSTFYNDETDEITKDKINNIIQKCIKNNWILKSTLNINDNNFLFESQLEFNNFLRGIKNQ